MQDKIILMQNYDKIKMIFHIEIYILRVKLLLIKANEKVLPKINVLTQRRF